jgi:hypothetical protein
MRSRGVRFVPGYPRGLDAVGAKDEVLATRETVLMREVRHHKLKNKRAVQKIGLNGFDPRIVQGHAKIFNLSILG